MPFDLFVSHSSNDDEIVTKIHDQLTKAGLSVWADHCDALGVSDRWDMEIDKALKDSVAGLFILSPDGVMSPHCMAECQKVISLGRRLYIVMVRNIPEEDIPTLLFNIQYESVVTDFDGGINRLVKKITGKAAVTNAPVLPREKKISGGFPKWHLDIPLYGREDELGRVRAVLDGGTTRHVVQITGIGGVGKTRLAAEVVKLVDYADGVVWHDCRIVSLSTLAATIREQIGMPPATDEQTWDELDKHVLLLVLDNGEDCNEPAAYTTMINRLGNKARVILTSRMRWNELKRTPEFSLIQPNLTAASQIMCEFADKEAGIDVKDTAEILAKSAYQHPRLMEIVASWLRDKTVSRVMEELHSLVSDDAKEALEEMIARSVERVKSTMNGETAILVLRKLSVCRGGFTTEAAKTIAGEDEFGKVLKLLRNWGLLRFEGERYEIDPLVIETVGEDEDAHRTHLEYYQTLARQHTEKQDYFGLDIESANLEAAFEWALKVNNIELAFSFTNACHLFQGNRGRFGQRLNWLMRLGPLMTEGINDHTRAAFANSCGLAFQEYPLGQIEKNVQRAILAFEQALQFWTPDTSPLNYAMAQNNLGEAYRSLAMVKERTVNLHRAIAAYEQALRFWTPDTSPFNYATTQNNLGIVYGMLAEIEERKVNLWHSIAAFEQALHFRTPVTTPLDYAATQNNLGNVYGMLSEVEEKAENLHRAVATYEQALRFWTPNTAPLNYAMMQNNLGIIYASLAQIEERDMNLSRAIKAYEQALRFRTPNTAPLHYAMTQHGLGKTYAESGDLNAAVQCWCAAEKYYRQMGHIREADMIAQAISKSSRSCD